MKIILDTDRCQGHGRCYSLAPELFGYDDDGQAVVLVADELTEVQIASAQRAANNCPEYAIDVG